MKPEKRKKLITHKQFCDIFTKREFNFLSKIFKSIYFVEDIDGNYRIEEKANLKFKLVALLLLPLLIPVSLILVGALGVIESGKDNLDVFSDKPSRVDECKHNIKSTAQLLELTGWYN